MQRAGLPLSLLRSHSTFSTAIPWRALRANSVIAGIMSDACGAKKPKPCLVHRPALRQDVREVGLDDHKLGFRDAPPAWKIVNHDQWGGIGEFRSIGLPGIPGTAASATASVPSSVIVSGFSICLSVLPRTGVRVLNRFRKKPGRLHRAIKMLAGNVRGLAQPRVDDGRNAATDWRWPPGT